MSKRVAVTGADGFLGWHLACLARTSRDVEVVGLGRPDLVDPETLAAKIADVDAVIHLAGANRGTDVEISDTNRRLAEVVAGAVARTPAVRVIYANSTHADGQTVYGKSKAEAATILRRGVGPGASVVDVVLPHLFGEHGRPFYNSFVATFCQQLAVGDDPSIDGDRTVELLHARDASGLLLELALSEGQGEDVVRPSGHATSVGDVFAVLTRQAAEYASGVFPDLSSLFEARLFNQLRSYAQPFNIHDRRSSRFDSPRALPQHVDERGGLVEIAKAFGGQSQSFFSTTNPGVSRGNHFHTYKVERFAVVSGDAEIALRRVGQEQIHRFSVSGREPVVVDIPTLHTHSITNVGQTELLTLFWTDEVFDPDAPDTYAEPVAVAG
jgi:UDP-2-acetamido-2,6-beta-L-arabino-hexul-4-ose reductase